MKKTISCIIFLAFFIKTNAQQPNSIEPAGAQYESPSQPATSTPTSVAPAPSTPTHATPTTTSSSNNSPTNHHNDSPTNYSSNRSDVYHDTNVFLDNYSSSTTVVSTNFANAEPRTIYRDRPTATEALQRLIVLCDDLIYSYNVKGTYARYDMKNKVTKVKDYTKEMQFQTVYLEKKDFKKLRPMLKHLEIEADEMQTNKSIETVYEMRAQYDKIFILLRELEKELSAMEDTN
jgi:alpha-ketoglutarate-dependent taurine dioxygenase